MPTIQALEAMETYGGSFVRSLADCYLRADPQNRAALLDSRLKRHFDRYEDIARTAPSGSTELARIVEKHSDWWIVAIRHCADAHGYAIPDHAIKILADTVAFLVEDDDTPCDRLEVLKREVAHG